MTRHSSAGTQHTKNNQIAPPTLSVDSLLANRHHAYNSTLLATATAEFSIVSKLAGVGIEGISMEGIVFHEGIEGGKRRDGDGGGGGMLVTVGVGAAVEARRAWR
jgi:hypothetical protein